MPRISGKTQMADAIRYMLTRWDALTLVLRDGRACIDNNAAERAMRPVPLGRKNWLHVGSAKSGPKIAAILSVVESCRRLGLPVKDYLLAVLPGMGQRKQSELAQLTPARWKASRMGRC